MSYRSSEIDTISARPLFQLNQKLIGIACFVWLAGCNAFSESFLGRK